MKIGDKVTFTDPNVPVELRWIDTVGEVVGLCWGRHDLRGDPWAYGQRFVLVKFGRYADPLAILAPRLRVLSPLEQLAGESE